MILLNGTDPLEDFLALIVAENPTLAGKFTSSNIRFKNIVTQTAAEILETGCNTRAKLYGVGDLATTIGMRWVYWNRVKLSAVFPASSIRIQTATKFGYFYPAEMDAIISKALGTSFELTGTYADYTPGAKVALAAGGISYSWNLVIPTNSLRYIPETIKFNVESVGESLEQVITIQGVYPYRLADGSIFNPLYNTVYMGKTKRLPGEAKRSYMMTWGRITWTDVWGGSPPTVITGSSNNYRFTDAAWTQINLKLAVMGLKPLPTNFFKAYAAIPTTNRNYVSTMEYLNTNACLYITLANTDWNHVAADNLFLEMGTVAPSTTYGYLPTTTISFPYTY